MHGKNTWNPTFKQKACKLQADYARYDAVTLTVKSIEALIRETKDMDKIA